MRGKYCLTSWIFYLISQSIYVNIKITMLKIKKRIEKELPSFIRHLDKTYCLNKLSPLLFQTIKDFIARPGKRIRPILFIIGYKGYAKKEPQWLFRSALSIELLHDFMLVHDDIIDKSDMRRGKPSAHKMLNNYLAKFKKVKFSGQDLAVVVGDVMYACGIDAFMSVEERKENKELALSQLNRAAIFTGCGEFIELLCGLININKVKKEQIYKIYDYKTAYYTFSAPLAMGCLLAGASNKEAKELINLGLHLGRAFQIRDDYLGLFGDERKIGKSVLSDLQEEKRTIFIWHAYNNALKKDKLLIKSILSKKDVTKKDLIIMRKLLIRTGSLDFAKQQIMNSSKSAQKIIASSLIKPQYKEMLLSYCQSAAAF